MKRLHPAPLARILPTALLLWPLSVLAHVEGGAAGGFFIGFHHPISGLDHVLAMVAVGLWGAQLGAPAIWLLPVAFPIMMAFGGLLHAAGIGIGLMHRWDAGRVALRGAGSAVMAGGLFFLWRALA